MPQLVECKTTMSLKSSTINTKSFFNNRPPPLPIKIKQSDF